MGIGVAIIATGVALAAKKTDKKEGKMATSCVATAKGPLAVESKSGVAPASNQPGTLLIQARVGQPAPDFEANAFTDGNFKNLKLSDYKGKWVVLCFYPGDFTFV